MTDPKPGSETDAASFRICVFCGSRSGRGHAYEQAARETGAALAARGIGLVYGGGSVGMMGTIADACLADGGEVIGVIPDAMVREEIAHPGVTLLRIVDSMHERKAVMASLADAFLALPGGYGTFEEFCEIVTWAQLGLHRKPCGLLNVSGYFDPLLALFDRAVEEDFLLPDHRSLVIDGREVRSLLDRLITYRPPILRPKLTPRE